MKRTEHQSQRTKSRRPSSLETAQPAQRKRCADIGAFRRLFAHYVTAAVGVTNERIISAFETIAREDFVGPGPWQIAVRDGYISTKTDDPTVLYQDFLIGLAPERDINNGQPSLHACCLAAANPQPNEFVIHVGAGTGYYTAILAHLVGEGGTVEAYEIDGDIAARGTGHLAGRKNVRVHTQSALSTNLPVANVIYVCAGATHVPPVFLDALAVGGRLVLPLTPNEGIGCMLLVTRQSATEFAARIFSTAAFINCIGARDDAQSESLAAALKAGGTDRVRSLRRDGVPDATAWCVGTGWWLSTGELLAGAPTP